MKPNLANMTKAEIVDLYRWRCSHGHNGISHYNCYLRERDIKERIGCLDIEASNLKADFGIMLSWAIKPLYEDWVYYDAINPKDLKSTSYDKRITESLVETMEEFDRFVVHYGTKFDLPFIRTRAVYHRLDFPQYGEKILTDTYYMARNKMCFHSNRQGSVAKGLGFEDIKTRIEPEYWIGALQGKKNCIDYILDHNIKDVYQLEQNYLALRPYVKKNNRSI